MYLQGFQESRESLANNSYISLAFYKCDYDNERNTAEMRANCASDQDDWLYDKVFEPYVFQNRIAFDNYTHPHFEVIERNKGISLDPSTKTTMYARIH